MWQKASMSDPHRVELDHVVLLVGEVQDFAAKREVAFPEIKSARQSERVVVISGNLVGRNVLRKIVSFTDRDDRISDV